VIQQRCQFFWQAITSSARASSSRNCVFSRSSVAMVTVSDVRAAVGPRRCDNARRTPA
jgi:hypothetical protein